MIKRGLPILLLTMLLLFSLVLAVDTTNTSQTTNLTINKDNITKTTAQILDEIKARAEEESLLEELRQDNATSIFTTPLPSILDKPTRVIFNIPEGDDVSLEKFIVLIGCLIILFIFILEALAFSTFSEEISAIIALALTVIASVTGQLMHLFNFFYTITDKIIFLGNMSKTKLFIALAIILIVMITLKILTKKFVQTKKKEKAREKGSEVGSAIRNAKAINKAVSSK